MRRVAMVTLVLVACGARQTPEAAPGPLRIDPDFGTLAVEGWAGIGEYTALVKYGFTADSSRFVSCHVDLAAKDFRGVCEVIDPATGEVVERRADPGETAPAGLWRGPEVLAWHARKTGERTDQLDFFWRDPSGKETPLASFDAEPGMSVYPEAAIVSPDGTRLALVVDQVGGPPLTTEVKIVTPSPP